MVSSAPLNPSKKSSDIQSMESRWQTARDLLAGQAAVRAGGEKYLKRFPSENRDSYQYRLSSSKFTNLFRDISENLVAQAFSKQVELAQGSASTELRNLAETDIDGRGNALGVFARSLFANGINFGLGLILIDAPEAPAEFDERVMSVADAKKHGIRPYWHNLDPNRLLALRSANVGGREEIVHVRFTETVVEEEDFIEVTKERVRVFDRAKLADSNHGPVNWQVWEKQKGAASHLVGEWALIKSGTLSISSLPLVPFITASRNGWAVDLPLQAAADLQISHYVQESELQNLKLMSCFPMLVAEGIEPPKDAPTLPIGPGCVLFAPPTVDGGTSTWKLLEPTAASMRQMSDDIERTERQLRELGRNPLTAASGNITAVTSAFAAQKGNASIQSWSLGLKDALERALQITADWLGDTKSKPEVQVNTDLNANLIGENADATKALQEARKNRDISHETYINELKRRGTLSPGVSAQTELERLAIEGPDADTEEDIHAAITPFNRNL